MVKEKDDEPSNPKNLFENNNDIVINIYNIVIPDFVKNEFNVKGRNDGRYYWYISDFVNYIFYYLLHDKQKDKFKHSFGYHPLSYFDELKKFNLGKNVPCFDFINWFISKTRLCK